MLPSTRQNGVGIATVADFGAESSRPASLLCTLRTHQSPGEWQHSLPACLLTLAGRDLHPLDSIKKFHRFIFGSSPSTLSQRDNNVGHVKSFFVFSSSFLSPFFFFEHTTAFTPKSGLVRLAHLRIDDHGSLIIFRSASVRPNDLFDLYFDHD